jgi:hypothetical protein
MTTQESSVASFSLEIQTVSQYAASSTASLSPSVTRTSSPATVKHPRPSRTKERIKRKVTGFLRFVEGNRARVVFDAGNGEPIEYYLSAELLKQNGVTVPQQPFELIEGVRLLSKTEAEQFTKITPLAPASSAQIEPVDLPAETRSNIQYILAKLNAKP